MLTLWAGGECGEVKVLGGGRGPGAEEDDAIEGEAGFASGCGGGGEVGGLGDEGFGAGVFELEGEFVDRVEGVGGRDDAAGPEGAEGEDWGLGPCQRYWWRNKETDVGDCLVRQWNWGCRRRAHRPSSTPIVLSVPCRTQSTKRGQLPRCKSGPSRSMSISLWLWGSLFSWVRE